MLHKPFPIDLLRPNIRVATVVNSLNLFLHVILKLLLLRRDNSLVVLGLVDRLNGDICE